ncbi:DNA (cytosine-5-)-methyltransferase [Campylobacter upsaliensis]
MKIGSLFAGIGGIELGFLKAGFKTAWAVELDSKACITYRANHKHKLINDDLAKVDLKSLSKIDILTAGFPCQAFSVAGYQKGFNDERGNVFFEILRYLDHFKPSIIFLENVKNLFKHDKGRTFETIKEKLQKRGYFLKYQILNTSEYGNIPQNRERIYIVGFLDFHTYESFHFPAKIKLTRKIEHLLEKGVDKSFYYTSHRYYPELKKELQSKETLYKNDLLHFLERQIFLDIFKGLDLEQLKDKSLAYIKQNTDELQFKFIQSKLSKILEKALFLASMDGFSANLLQINSGVMISNAGDSAEFLFVARAILAGFNASSVDVRSSRYDAIVDYNGTLLRIQIKGITGGLISFKDRDRGGQGIDYKHQSNQGKRITSKDCDIYAAVDKQVGICYLIPMSFADSLNDKECEKVILEQISLYKENWDIIKLFATKKLP